MPTINLRDNPKLSVLVDPAVDAFDVIITIDVPFVAFGGRYESDAKIRAQLTQIALRELGHFYGEKNTSTIRRQLQAKILIAIQQNFRGFPFYRWASMIQTMRGRCVMTFDNNPVYQSVLVTTPVDNLRGGKVVKSAADLVAEYLCDLLTNSNTDPEFVAFVRSEHVQATEEELQKLEILLSRED